jgi:hypothetical protein
LQLLDIGPQNLCNGPRQLCVSLHHHHKSIDVRLNRFAFNTNKNCPFTLVALECLELELESVESVNLASSIQSSNYWEHDLSSSSQECDLESVKQTCWKWDIEGVIMTSTKNVGKPID